VDNEILTTYLPVFMRFLEDSVISVEWKRTGYVLQSRSGIEELLEGQGLEDESFQHCASYIIRSIKRISAGEGPEDDEDKELFPIIDSQLARLRPDLREHVMVRTKSYVNTIQDVSIDVVTRRSVLNPRNVVGHIGVLNISYVDNEDNSNRISVEMSRMDIRELQERLGELQDAMDISYGDTKEEE